MLARREAAGERGGVIVRSTTACRWRSQLADDKSITDTFGSAIDESEDGAPRIGDGAIEASRGGPMFEPEERAI